jgi:hypothetical protein
LEKAGRFQKMMFLIPQVPKKLPWRKNITIYNSLYEGTIKVIHNEVVNETDTATYKKITL